MEHINVSSIAYFATLVFGERWPLLLTGLVLTLIIAYRNCFSSSGTGRVFYRHGNGLFIFLSSVAGCFHFADLMCGWIEGKLEIVAEEAFENPGNADIVSILIAILFGLAIGFSFYAAAQLVMVRRTEFMERRYFLKHIRAMRWQDQKRYY